MKKKILITGGGTGGHVLAGLAVAEIWGKKFSTDSDICFVGAAEGIETKLVPRAGYSLQTLRVGTLNRVGWRKKLKTFCQIPLALMNAAMILLRFRPQFVLGVGGYASGPVVLVARILNAMGLVRARIAILEQNSIPGLTNRVLSRFAHLVLVAFPGSENHFPGKKVVLTGNPIRSVMKPIPSANRNPFTIFVFGGSQGAVGMNTLVLDALPHLKADSGRIQWIHQTGERDFERVLKGYHAAGVRARVEKFIYDMVETYAKASLLICRSGSSSLAEIAAVRRASILIPLPTAADHHQERNAQVFVDRGAARLLLQTDAQGKDLADMIRELVNQPALLETMEESVGQFCRPQAAEDVVRALLV